MLLFVNFSFFLFFVGIIYLIRIVLKRRRMPQQYTFFEIVQLFGMLFLCWAAVFFGLTTFVLSDYWKIVIDIIDTLVFSAIGITSGVSVYRMHVKERKFLKLQPQYVKKREILFSNKSAFLMSLESLASGLCLAEGVWGFRWQMVNILFLIIGVLLSFDIIRRFYREIANAK